MLNGEADGGTNFIADGIIHVLPKLKLNGGVAIPSLTDNSFSTSPMIGGPANLQQQVFLNVQENDGSQLTNPNNSLILGTVGNLSRYNCFGVPLYPILSYPILPTISFLPYPSYPTLPIPTT